jgi:di/tricarboxylate transporter
MGQALGVPALIAGFPSELFVTLLGVSLLFTQAEVNGTLVRVAAVAQGLCRGQRGLVPVMFFVLAAAVGTAGPGNIAVAGLMAPLALAAAERAGIPPFLMAVMVGHGAIASTLSPFTAAGVVADTILSDMGLAGQQWRIYAWNAGANAVVACAGYLLFGGWKLFRRPVPIVGSERDPVAPPPSGAVERLPFELRHGVTLVVIAALIAIVLLGKAQIGLAAMAGAALLSVLRLADERETWQKLPWGVIVMVCGVSVLT